MDIFSLSGALSDVQDGTQALPPDVEKLLSMETVPVDLFITEVPPLPLSSP